MDVPFDPLRDVRIDPALLLAIASIDEFKGRWTSLGRLAPERLSSLRRVATIESVGSSTRIEGSKLTDDEVDRLLSGVRVESFRTRDEQEVAGYGAAMETVFESFASIPLTENHVRQLHATILRYSEKDERYRGHYKNLPSSVEALDETGRSVGVVFETATPFDTPRRMTELVEWTRGTLDAGTTHPLLVIGAFVVHFLAIHPFQDGNGRLSRVLTTLLLLRAGYAYVPFSSLERVIEDSKDEYYRSLRRAQGRLSGDGSLVLEWISFFARCLVRQKEVLERRLERERLLAPLPPLSEALVGIVRERGRLSVRDAAAWTGASRNTIKDHLAQLVRSGVLARRGRGRGSWYERA